MRDWYVIFRHTLRSHSAADCGYDYERHNIILKSALWPKSITKESDSGEKKNTLVMTTRHDHVRDRRVITPA